MSDFEKMIEAEVEKRVEERIHRSNVNYRVKFYQEQLEILNNIKGRVSRVFDEQIKNLEEKIEYNQYDQPKCDFPECKNFGEGDVDEMCKECANHQVKNDTIKQHDIEQTTYQEEVAKRKAANDEHCSNCNNESCNCDSNEDEDEEDMTLDEYEKYLNDTFKTLFGNLGIKFKLLDKNK